MSSAADAPATVGERGRSGGAEAGDPDERVYVGAEAGQENHCIAAKPTANAAAPAAPKTSDGGYGAAPAAAMPLPAVAAVEAGSLKQFGRTSSALYWAADAWDPDENIYVGAGAGMQNHLAAVKPETETTAVGALTGAAVRETPSAHTQAMAQVTGASEVEEPLARVSRVNSGHYWGSDAWDPDERVYTGADIGQQNHITAVQPKLQGAAEATQSTVAQTKRADAPVVPVAATTASGGEKPGSPVQKVAPKTPTLADMGRSDSAAYWGKQDWDPDERLYTGADSGQNPLSATKPTTEPCSATNASASAKPAGACAMPDMAAEPGEPSEQRTLAETGRVSSGHYWGADAWDPDERVYTGADLGQGHHLTAVQPP